MKLVKQISVMSISAALMAAGSLCINASKVDGKMQYMSATVMLLVEFFKGLVCCLAISMSTSKHLWLGWAETLYFAAPALLYTIDNNLVFVILRFIDPATLSILWNLKIFTTAILFRFVLRRSISHLQVISLVLLMLGVATTQSKQSIEPMLQHHENISNGSMVVTKDNGPKFIFGLGLVGVACVISSLAGIVTEYALKKNPQTPFVLQNLYLAFFSICFNGIAVLAQIDADHTFFSGYNDWTWVVVCIQVLAGLCMGLILKFLDNIACVYSHAMAMMFTTIVSIIFFSFDLTIEFACGFSVCVVSMYLYHLKIPGSPSQCHGAADVEEYEKLAPSSMDSETVLESPCDVDLESNEPLSPRRSPRLSTGSPSESTTNKMNNI